MEREIEFRGKRVDNSEWVYGDLVRLPKNPGTYSEPPSLELTTYISDTSVLTHELIEVGPKTVGQYTGLKDKNRKRIYGGDIVRSDGCWLMRIEFEGGVFWVRDTDAVRYANKVCNIPISNLSMQSCWEVIGNIYENKGDPSKKEPEK